MYTHAGSTGVSYIHIRSHGQPTPTYLNCSVKGRVDGQLYVDVRYFLTLAGAILCDLSIGIGLLYVCIKSDPCCFQVLYSVGDSYCWSCWMDFLWEHLPERSIFNVVKRSIKMQPPHNDYVSSYSWGHRR